MPKSVKVDVASLPEGAEVEVPGLGVFKNGSTTEVSDAALKQYELAGFQVPEGDFNLKYGPAPEGPTKFSEAEQGLEASTKKSSEALQAAMRLQETRREDPLATANIALVAEEVKSKPIKKEAK